MTLTFYHNLDRLDIRSNHEHSNRLSGTVPVRKMRTNNAGLISSQSE
jgi:hypothetical protein